MEARPRKFFVFVLFFVTSHFLFLFILYPSTFTILTLVNTPTLFSIFILVNMHTLSSIFTLVNTPTLSLAVGFGLAVGLGSRFLYFIFLYFY